MTPDIAPASARKPSDVLEAAADLIEPEGAWTRGDYGRDLDGEGVWGDDPAAVCFCVLGSLQAATGRHDGDATAAVEELLSRVLPPGGVPYWNDRPERTQPEVVTALRKAAALARSEGQ